MIKIKQLKSLNNFKLSVVFEDGKTKVFDVTPYLEKGIFQELKDPNYFKQVKNEGYFLRWPHEQDLSADTLYVEGCIETRSVQN